MQTNFINTGELANLLEQSEILSVDDQGGVRQYVLTFDGQDILAFAGTEGAFITYPCAAFDAETGGSTHDHCRASLDA
jgi:hypothetical protein